jgi:enamine deaminase RidA (YjgF/YER057c/UK114 family)
MPIQRYEPDAIMSQAVECNGLVFLSGVTANDQSASMKGQTEEILATIDQRLARAGTDKSRIVSATCYVTDKSREPEMNEAWTAWIDPTNPPARATVGVTLGSPDKLVEIVVVAMK